MKTRLMLFVAVVGVGGLTSPARAGLVIDQQFRPDASFGNGADSGTSIPFNSPLYQTFTPTSGSIGFATFVLQDVQGGSGTYDVEVRSGSDGTLLGTSKAVTLAAGFGSGVPDPGAKAEFDFAAPIGLVAGQTYSLVPVRLDASSNYFVYGDDGQDGGTYAGGGFFYTSNGHVIAAGELSFSEGNIVPNSVPEPGSLALVASATPVGFGMWWRRRKRSA